MKTGNKKMEAIVKKTVNYLVDTEQYGWPPQCGTFLYQPTRPKRQANVLPKSKPKTQD